MPANTDSEQLTITDYARALTRARATIREKEERIRELEGENAYFREQLTASNGRREDARDVIENAVNAAGGTIESPHLAQAAKWIAHELLRVVHVLDGHGVPTAPTAAARVRAVVSEWTRLRKATGKLGEAE